jgi:RimJ/RimL family protein N-acetyltransferase
MQLEKITPNDIENICKFYDKNYEFLSLTDNVPDYKNISFSNNMFDYISKKQLIVYSLKDNDNVVGMYFIEEINKSFYNCCSLSYSIDKDYSSKGITTTIIKNNLNWFLNDAGVSKLRCTVSKNNASSIRVLEKLKFNFFGPIPQYFKINNKMEDCYIAYSNIN